MLDSASDSISGRTTLGGDALIHYAIQSAPYWMKELLCHMADHAEGMDFLRAGNRGFKVLKYLAGSIRIQV